MGERIGLPLSKRLAGKEELFRILPLGALNRRCRGFPSGQTEACTQKAERPMATYLGLSFCPILATLREVLPHPSKCLLQSWRTGSAALRPIRYLFFIMWATVL